VVVEPQVAAILMGVDAALTSGDRRFGTKDEHANHETDPQGLTCLLVNAASTWPLPYEPPPGGVQKGEITNDSERTQRRRRGFENFLSRALESRGRSIFAFVCQS